MSRTRGWTGLRNSVIAFGLVAAAAGVSRADALSASTGALVAYETSGTVGTTGVTGDLNAITFTPLIGASFMSPSSLDLGVFQTKALADGQTVTFNNTPFDIKFKVDNVNNGTGTLTPNGSPVDITGVLNGTLSGANQSTVVATFDSTAATATAASAPVTKTFATGLYTNTLQVSGNTLAIVPSTSFNGMTTTQGTLTTELTLAMPAPEPSTVVLFAATIAGIGLRHRFRRARTAG